LFLTDILATFAENPLEPAYGALDPAPAAVDEELRWIDGTVDWSRSARR
jgi:hypothetical protein